MSQKFARVEVDLLAAGQGRVLIDGADVSKLITAVTVRAEAGRPPQVELRVLADTWLKMPAHVRAVVVPEYLDPTADAEAIEAQGIPA